MIDKLRRARIEEGGLNQEISHIVSIRDVLNSLSLVILFLLQFVLFSKQGFSYIGIAEGTLT